jgi:hypothetical protein
MPIARPRGMANLKLNEGRNRQDRNKEGKNRKGKYRWRKEPCKENK